MSETFFNTTRQPQHTDTMDFPLPIRSVTTMDSSTPLHVDTNIEYTLDMEKFREINEPSHYWQPALVIDSQCSMLPNPSSTSLEMTTLSHDMALRENHRELLDLIDTYALGDLQEGDVDFTFIHLAPSSSDSVLDTSGVFLDGSFTSDLELSVDDIQRAADDSGFVSETDEGCDDQRIPQENVLTSCGLEEMTRASKRKRSESGMSAKIDLHLTVCKRRKLEVKDEIHKSVAVMA